MYLYIFIYMVNSTELMMQGGKHGIMESCGILWNLVESCGTLWNLMESCEILWNPMESTGIHGIGRNPREFYRILRFSV